MSVLQRVWYRTGRPRPPLSKMLHLCPCVCASGARQKAIDRQEVVDLLHHVTHLLDHLLEALRVVANVDLDPSRVRLDESVEHGQQTVDAPLPPVLDLGPYNRPYQAIAPNNLDRPYQL